MGKVLESKQLNRSCGARASRVKAIVRRMPKMPAAQRRRLNELIGLGATRRLTKSEDKEVRGLLDLIDRQTYWNLAEAIEIEARTPAERKVRKTG